MMIRSNWHARLLYSFSCMDEAKRDCVHSSSQEEGFLPAFVKFLKGEQDDSAILEKLREIDGYLSKKVRPSSASS